MATYTIELRRVCDIYGRDEVENWFKDYELSHYLTPIQIEQIQKFNVWSKDRLAEKIVDHYFMREIGFETPALFKHFAQITMKEIMERQLPKIYSNFLEYDPLSNVDFTETYTREIQGTNTNEGSQESSGNSNITQNGNTQGTSNSTSNSENSSLNVNSDTPQGQISKSEILQGKYASNTTANENEGQIEDETITSQTSENTQKSTDTSNINTNTKENTNTIEKFTRHEEGDNGVIITNQRLIKEFREIIVAIDEEIILELNKLFIRFILIRKDKFYVRFTKTSNFKTFYKILYDNWQLAKLLSCKLNLRRTVTLAL